MAEKTTDWPSFRLNPTTRKRLGDLLDRAKNETPIMRVIDAILNDAIDQAVAADPKPLLPFIASIRAQLGLSAGADFDAAIDAAVEARFVRIENALVRAKLLSAEDSQLPRAAETSGKPKS